MPGPRPPQVTGAIDTLALDVKLAVRVDIEDVGVMVVAGPLLMRRIGHMHDEGMPSLPHCVGEESDITGPRRGVDHGRDIPKPHPQHI